MQALLSILIILTENNIPHYSRQKEHGKKTEQGGGCLVLLPFCLFSFTFLLCISINIVSWCFSHNPEPEKTNGAPKRKINNFKRETLIFHESIKFSSNFHMNILYIILCLSFCDFFLQSESLHVSFFIILRFI